MLSSVHSANSAVYTVYNTYSLHINVTLTNLHMTPRRSCHILVKNVDRCRESVFASVFCQSFVFRDNPQRAKICNMYSVQYIIIAAHCDLDQSAYGFQRILSYVGAVWALSAPDRGVTFVAWSLRTTDGGLEHVFHSVQKCDVIFTVVFTVTLRVSTTI